MNKDITKHFFKSLLKPFPIFIAIINILIIIACLYINETNLIVKFLFTTYILLIGCIIIHTLCTSKLNFIKILYYQYNPPGQSFIYKNQLWYAINNATIPGIYKTSIDPNIAGITLISINHSFCIYKGNIHYTDIIQFYKDYIDKYLEDKYHKDGYNTTILNLDNII